MKKLLTFITLTVLASTFANAQITKTFNNKISAKFPTEPKDIVKRSVMSIAKDTSTIFIVSVMDLNETAHLDSATIAQRAPTAEFAAEFKTGLVNSLPGATLADFKVDKWNGYTSYSSMGSDTKINDYDIFIVFIGTNLYSFTTVRKPGADIKLKESFFTSITLIK